MGKCFSTCFSTCFSRQEVEDGIPYEDERIRLLDMERRRIRSITRQIRHNDNIDRIIEVMNQERQRHEEFYYISEEEPAIPEYVKRN